VQKVEGRSPVMNCVVTRYFVQTLFMCGEFFGPIMLHQYLLGSTYLAHMLWGSFLSLYVGKKFTGHTPDPN